MARLARALPLAVLALSSTACGGTDDGRPSAGSASDGVPPDPCLADDGYEFQNIVNFNPRLQGQTTVFTAICDAATPCTFYFNYDEGQSPENPDAPRMRGVECLEPVDSDAVAFTQPRIAAQTFIGEPIDGGRCDEEHSALHIIATNVGMCYGPDGRLGWGAGLDINFSPPIDAREWEGISFWVRNSAPVPRAFILSVSDPITSGGAVNPDTGMPYCSSMDPPPGAPPVPDSQKCDAFGVAVTASDEWTFVPAVFSSMRQKGFGVPSHLGQLDTQSISRVQLLMSAGSWDFWLDDFALFRREE
jgi:hypothetical protein